MPGRAVPFHREHVVIRSNQVSYRLLNHIGGGVRLSPAGYTTATVGGRRNWSEFGGGKQEAPGSISEPNDSLAVIVEQYRDHGEAYLPGGDPDWHSIEVTPDRALEFLVQWLRQEGVTGPGRTSPVGVSLVTINPETRHLNPAVVERAPLGVQVLFSGHVRPSERPAATAKRLQPGEAIPSNAVPGDEFIQPSVTQGAEEPEDFPGDAVVIRMQPGEDHRVLGHAGPVIEQFPARLIRVQQGVWDEARHQVYPVD
jgi:hypothetical protein